jgi:hypothetical protein
VLAITKKRFLKSSVDCWPGSGCLRFGQYVVEMPPLALGNFLTQIRQPNIGTVALNQSLLSILASPSAFGARQAHYVGGVVAELQ